MSAASVYAIFTDAAEAERVGETVIAERLAACINILPPMRSIYRWQGEIMRADEVAAILKTSQAAAAALIARIVELHSYEVPCVVAWPIADLPEPFAAWIADSVG
jgi:periplasmic divalent cation tolerance protein